MPRPRPENLHDELDALLDGRPVELAAALVLAPATMASAAALPGQAMYPFKRAIEQLRLASVQWSPGGEAVERTRPAHERLEELQRLVELKLYNRLPTAIEALEEAVVAARVAVSEAERDGAAVKRVAQLLDQVKGRGAQVVLQVATKVEQARLPGPTRAAIKEAVEDSQDVLPVPDRTVEGTKNPPAAGGGTATTQPPVTTPPTSPTPTTGTPPTGPPPTNPPTPTHP